MRARSAPGEYRALTIAAITGVILFVGFAYYYAVGAKYLPRGAGPDSAAHYDIAKFIYQNERLAVLPGDEEELLFTPYGTTRALRPPLSYLVSAAVAGFIHRPDRDLFRVLRLGSGVLCALAVVVTFITIWLLFGHYWLAFMCSLLFGLLPQLAFIGIYTNDDSSAIFSATLLSMAVMLVHRHKLCWWTSILLGTSIGLVVLSKFTAWLLLPALLVFLLPLMWRQRNSLHIQLPLILVAFVIGGGWWIGFNMSQYGVDDPLLFKATREASQNHARIPTPGNRGFASQGISYYQLIIDNHKNFIGESFKATIGNLDWLRLRLGWLQYGLYLLVVFVALAYLPLSTLIKSDQRAGVYVGDRPLHMFFWSLFIAILFQVFMYVYFNMYHDIQIQGKYMLPVLLPVLVLFAAGVLTTARLIRASIDYLDIQDSEAKFVMFILTVLSLSMVIGSHAHGLKAYFLPFYYPDAMRYQVRPFKTVDLQDVDLIQATHMAHVVTSPDGLHVESLGKDPQLILGSKLCELFSINTMLQIDVTSESTGDIKVYVDDGAGFSEPNSSGQRYHEGTSRLVIAIGSDKCRNIRIDPRSTPGSVTIKRIAIAPFQVSAL